MKRIPYFYIIQHKPTGLLYAGAKWGKTANPENFMKPQGYQTSSNKVKKLIEHTGLESFEIIQLLTESECGLDVYEYETWYLNNFNIARRPNWLNTHSNRSVATGVKAGAKWYTNSIIEIRVEQNEEPPEGFIPGRIYKTSKGKIAYHNHINQIYITEDEAKNYTGYIKGRLPSAVQKTQNSQKNSIIYNDGITEFRVSSDQEIPKEWVKGKLKKNIERIKNSRSKFINSTMWNDGFKTYQIREGDYIDPTWVKGMVKF